MRSGTVFEPVAAAAPFACRSNDIAGGDGYRTDSCGLYQSSEVKIGGTERDVMKLKRTYGERP